MNRDAAYQELVRRRKAHQFPDGLLNPSRICDGRYDTDHLSPWSRWQGDLNADVVVVGQDWGDERYFMRNQGLDDDREQTCTNLREMAGAAGWDLGTPHAPNPQRLFFTNAVLGVRAEAGKSGAVRKDWMEDSLPFLVDLLDLIQPLAVVSLGLAAGRACRLALLESLPIAAEVPRNSTMRRLHALGSVRSHGKPVWFPFYHCSLRGMLNRGREMQCDDWASLGKWLTRHEVASMENGQG